jgi:hypothetical protein
MIYEVIQSLQPKLIELPFIDRYGGLVRIVKKGFTNDDGIYYKTFPVSCDITNTQCWENQRYKDLTPDERFKSISYFESAGNITIQKEDFLGRQSYKITAPLDFVCWLNLPKLGIQECHNSMIELMMIKFFHQDHKPNIENLVIANYKTTVKGISSRDEKIFSKYSYVDLSGLLLYPFDFFKISLELSFYIDPRCIHMFTPLPEILCHD